MKQLFLIIILAFFLILPASAVVIGGHDYSNLTKITINGANSKDLPSYHLMFVLSNTTGTDGVSSSNYSYNMLFLGNNVQPDWDDIRFTNGSNTSQIYDYWIETTNSSSATVWVEVLGLQKNTNKLINLYYNNATAISNSSGFRTFWFFDHFDEATLNTSKWAGSGSYSVSNSYLRLYNGGWLDSVYKNYTLDSRLRFYGNHTVAYKNYIGFHAINGSNAGRWQTDTPTASALQVNQYYGGSSHASVVAYSSGMLNSNEILWNGSRITFTRDFSIVYNATSYIGSEPDKMLQPYASESSSNLFMDWIFIGNYTFPQPYYVNSSSEFAPKSNLTCNITAGLIPLSIEFYGVNSTGNNLSYYWDIDNDGSVDYTTQNCTHTYSSSVYYTVNFTVSNLLGVNSTILTNHIYAAPPLITNFTSNTTTGSRNLSVQFNDTTTGNPTSWNWSFGDGNYSTTRNASYIYNYTGVYTVNLTATNEYTSNTTVKTDYINVTPVYPVANFTSNVTSGYPLFVVYFTDTSENATMWDWYFPNGGDAHTQNAVWTFDYVIGNTITSYNISLKTTNQDGYNWSNKTDYITAYPLNASFSANSTIGECNLTVQFTDLTDNGTPIAWNWSFGDGNYSNSQNPIHTYEVVGSYEVILNASNLYSYDIEDKLSFIYLSECPEEPEQPITTPTPRPPLNGTSNTTQIMTEVFIPLQWWITLFMTALFLMVGGFIFRMWFLEMISMLFWLVSAFTTPAVGFVRDEVILLNLNPIIVPTVQLCLQTFEFWICAGFALLSFALFLLLIISTSLRWLKHDEGDNS